MTLRHHRATPTTPPTGKGCPVKRSVPLTALALALALTGCGGDAEEATPGTGPGATATAGTGPTSPPVSEDIAAEHNDQDVMFTRMMIPHHRQAVEMGELLLGKDGVPEDVRALAQRVVDTQEPEIERMELMLRTWGQPTMMESGGMGHDGMDHGGMGGMMGEEEMDRLAAAGGTDAARLFLEQMTVHHRGAIEMAREEVSGGQNPQAVAMAEDIIEAQEAEIAEMEALLQELPGRS